jgi:hypothetical protein
VDWRVLVKASSHQMAKIRDYNFSATNLFFKCLDFLKIKGLFRVLQSGILKRGGLESSGQRLISTNVKIRRMISFDPYKSFLTFPIYFTLKKNIEGFV